MIITLPSDLPIQLQKFSAIAVPNTQENREVGEINSGFILLTIDCEQKVLRLTTNIHSSSGIQGSIDLNVKSIHNPSDKKQFLVDANKFIYFLKKCEDTATKQKNALITLKITTKGNRIAFSVKQQEQTDKKNEKIKQEASIGYYKHRLHYIDASDEALILYDFSFPENSTFKHLEANSFTIALNNTLTVAKHNYQANKQAILGRNEFYLHLTENNNIVLYALSSVCLGVEVLPLLQGEVDKELYVSLGITTVITLLKLCSDASQIAITNEKKQLYFQIDSALLRVNTITVNKEASAIKSQLKINNSQAECQIETMKKMLTQFISDDKKHSIIVFEPSQEPSIQKQILKVTTKYNCSFNNDSKPESEVSLMSQSPFQSVQPYSYNLAAFDYAVSALTSGNWDCKWLVDNKGHLLIKQEDEEYKKFYKLVAIRKL